MASLRYIVNQFKDELRDGIAWLAFWKEGRSWKAECFWLDVFDERLSLEDKARLEKISGIDPGAVVLNGYYCGYLAEDMSIKDLAFGVRCHYENGYNNIQAFISSHEPGEFRERMEEAREAAHSVGLPFIGKYDPDEEFDPYEYDTSMCVGDVYRMHELMEGGG